MPVPPLTMPEGPLVGEDVVLREYRDGDVAMVQDLATDPYLPQIGTLPLRADENEALAYVARQRGRVEEGAGWSLCIADRTTDQAVGGVGLWLVDGDPRRLTIGYAVAPRARGHGFARQALEVLTAFTWTMPEVEQIDLFVEPWNVASSRTAEGAGYTRLGEPAQQDLRGRTAALLRMSITRPVRS